MYQGYMKRGVSLMMLFIAPIMIGAYTIDGIGFIASIVWAYTFFDTFHIARYTVEEKAALPDRLLFNIESLTKEDLQAVYIKRHRWIGIGAIAFGIMMIYNTFIAPVLWTFYHEYEIAWIAQVLNRLPSLAIAGVLIFVGYKMIKSHVKKIAQDDIIEYKEVKSHD